MSLIAHYPLNGDAKDYFGNDGTPSNVSWVDGKFGFASSSNNTSSRINIPTLDLPDTFSIAFWHYSDSTSGGTSWRTFLGAPSNTHPLIGQSRYNLGIFDGSFRSFGYSLTPNTWTHISVVYELDANKASLYIHGVYVSTTTTTYNQKSHPVTTICGSPDSSYAPATNCDFRVYDHALSEKEVQELALGKVAHYKFLNGSLKDCSGNGIDLVPYGDITGKIVPIEDSKTVAGYERLSTNNGGVFLDSEQEILLGDSFTMMCWCYVTADAGTSANGVISNHNHGNSTGAGITLKYMSASDVRISCNTGNGSGRTYNSYYGTKNIKSRWAHLVLRFEGNNLTLWVDGEIDNSLTYNQVNSKQKLSLFRWSTAYASATYLPAIKLDDVRVYNTAVPDSVIRGIYANGMSVDNHYNIHSKQLIESGIKTPNILDYTTWVVGSSGSQPGFGSNGPASENHIVSDTDPFGKTVPVWATIGSSDSNNDGGWNGNAYPVDHTKMHRISVWMRRTVTGNGTTYIGTTGSTIYNRSNNAANGNPYFWSGGLSSGNGWVLFVGHVWPSGSGAGANHPDSGHYTVSGGKVNSNMSDFILGAGSVSLGQRAYLFYSTNTATIQQFVYPRIDVCDGTEPSVEALLSGFDSINQDRINELGSSSVPDKPSIKYGGLGVGEFSEVGYMDNTLLDYAPFDRNRDMYHENSTAPMNNSVSQLDSAGGFSGISFDGANGKAAIYTVGSATASQALTWSAFVYPRALSGHKIFMSIGLPYMSVNGTNAFFSYTDGTQRTLGGGSVKVNEWNHICATHDGVTCRLYLNGTHVATSSFPLAAYNPSSIYVGSHSGNSYSFNGLVRRVKVFTSAISPEEVAQEYNAGMGKASLNKNTAFAKEFIEV